MGASALVKALMDEYPFDGAEFDWVSVRQHQDFHLPGRRDLLYLVLCTLTKNALQALRGRIGPSLRIELGLGALPGLPAQPWLRFIDNGPGIPAEILSRLTLEPVTTRAGSGGHGMGLMFCRRVMQSIGGGIEINSEPGEGCTVTLNFQGIEQPRT